MESSMTMTSMKVSPPYTEFARRDDPEYPDYTNADSHTNPGVVVDMCYDQILKKLKACNVSDDDIDIIMRNVDIMTDMYANYQ